MLSTTLDLQTTTEPAKLEAFDRITEILNALNSFEKLSDSLGGGDDSNTRVNENKKAQIDLENSSSEPLDDSLTESTMLPALDTDFYVTDESDKNSSLFDENEILSSSTSPPPKTTTFTVAHEKTESDLSWKNLMKANASTTSPLPPLTSASPITLSSADSSQEYEDSNESSSSSSSSSSSASSSQESGEYDDDEYEELVKLIMSKKANQTINNSSLVKPKENTTASPKDMPENTTLPNTTTELLLKNTTQPQINEEAEEGNDDDDEEEGEEDDNIDEDSLPVTNQVVTVNEPATTTTTLPPPQITSTESTTLKHLIAESTTAKEALNVPTSILANEYTSTNTQPSIVSNATITTTFATGLLVKNQTEKISTTARLESMTVMMDNNKPADLCNDPEVDAITRTEWGNAFIFKGLNNEKRVFMSYQTLIFLT